MKLCWKFALSIILFSGSIQATPLDDQINKLQLDVPRMREIVAIVIQNPNQPTKQIHDEFWGLILTRIHENPAKLSQSLYSQVAEPMEYQKALWESIKLSAKNKAVTKVGNLDAFHTLMPQMNGSKDYLDKEQAMLNASASGKPYTLRNGNQIALTQEVANNSLANIEPALKRLRKLTNSDWVSN
jgi:hypothetical protein